MKFEESFEKLKTIREKLENPEITLDESIKLYGESAKYAKNCLDTLSEGEGKILVIKNELDNLIEKPFDIDVSEE